MILFVGACVVGLVVLTKAADEFVAGAARLASALRVSPIVIGAVIVGFGTSAPEMVVSGLAAARGDPDLGVGNIVGSNIANISLVLGVAAMIIPLVVDSGTVRRELPMSVGACLMFAVLVWDGLSTIDGVILAVGLVLMIGYLLLSARRGDDTALIDEVEEYLEVDGTVGVWAESARTLLGLVGTLVGAQLLVWGALGVADEIGLSDGFVGLTLVAIGTSLPELVTAIAAGRRGEDELIIGNLLGSNIFNSLAVGATVALLSPTSLTDLSLTHWSVVIMMGVVALAAIFMVTARSIRRWEAGVLLAAYAVTIPVLYAV
jgi:cation:H+ antiporter